MHVYQRVGFNETLRRLDGAVSRSVLAQWVKESGLTKPTLETKLTEPRTYHKRNRLRLNDKLFRRIESLLKRKGTRITPNELRSLVLAYAIATDKRRLEEGDEGKQQESHDPEDIYLEGERKVLEFRKWHGNGSKT